MTSHIGEWPHIGDSVRVDGRPGIVTRVIVTAHLPIRVLHPDGFESCYALERTTIETSVKDVWVVHVQDRDMVRDLAGIFSSEEKAQQWIDADKATGDRADIVNWIVDGVAVSTDLASTEVSK